MNAPATAPLYLTFTNTGERGLVTRNFEAARAAAEREDAAGCVGDWTELADYFDGDLMWGIYPEDADLADSVRRFFDGFEGTAEDKIAGAAEGLAALRARNEEEP